jgi:tartrate-resistant acid phosphatase type 5
MAPSALSRRQLLTAASALVTAAYTTRVFASPRTNPLGFVVIGDWGREGLFGQREVAAAMGREAKLISSRFTATTGDNFYSFGVDSPYDPQWQSSFENIYTQEGLQEHWFATVGNHDYCGNIQAQIDYSKRNGRWRMPNRWYQVHGADMGRPDVDFFFLDTHSIANDPSQSWSFACRKNIRPGDRQRQLNWLGGALACSPARWKIVFGHHPIYSVGDHGDNQRMLELLDPVLREGGACVYICGHDHSLQHFTGGSIDYVCSGAGSQLTNLKHLGKSGGKLTKAFLSRGFASVQLWQDKATLKLIDQTGDELLRQDLPDPMRERTRSPSCRPPAAAA